MIDEYQMIGDPRRGLNYELGVALAPEDTQLLLLSGSVSNPHEVAEWIARLGRKVEVVQTHDRPVPLDEMPAEAYPSPAPRSVKNFWQRIAAGCLLSDFGPLLIFATQRKGAEKIAKKIADILPADDPIELDRDQAAMAGPILTRLLLKRVAYHHSGLNFAQRAGIVEPLAKAGQLRVVVATMGLAAGINFSMRSVYVADTQYSDGPFQRQVMPDELLQMFGRAGRRGLEEIGYVITAGDGPRLADAHAKRLRRANEIDWPTLLRVMNRAAEDGRSPFEAAAALTRRLFSAQHLLLGFEAHAASLDTEDRREAAGSRDSENQLFGLGPVRKEIRNSRGEWQSWQRQDEIETTLGAASAFHKERWRPAESVPDRVTKLLPPHARLCRLGSVHEKSGGQPYGAEFAIATRQPDGRYRLTKWLRKSAGLTRPDADATMEEWQALAPDLLKDELPHPPGELHWIIRGNALILQAGLSASPVGAYRDAHGKLLIEPETRSVAARAATEYHDETSGALREPPPNSAAYAWRKLGLIDAQGVPTARGTIFSFFQYGEGLAVAAALEDETYPIEDLALHLANLRGGHRFEAAELEAHSLGSERLAAACRNTYGPVDYESYLRLGAPIGYGEGTAEAVHLFLTDPQACRQIAAIDFGPGDIERACIEWLSLLRHIRHAPDFDHARWRQLKDEATRQFRHYSSRNPSQKIVDLTPGMLEHQVRHHLGYRQFQS